MIPLRLYLYGAALAALLASVWFYGHTRYIAGQRAEEAALTAYQAATWERMVKAQAAGREAVRRQTEKALAASEAGRKTAEERTAQWKRRYTEALQQPACSAWASQAVRCPVPST